MSETLQKLDESWGSGQAVEHLGKAPRPSVYGEKLPCQYGSSEMALFLCIIHRSRLLRIAP